MQIVQTGKGTCAKDLDGQAWHCCNISLAAVLCCNQLLLMHLQIAATISEQDCSEKSVHVKDCYIFQFCMYRQAGSGVSEPD